MKGFERLKSGGGQGSGLLTGCILGANIKGSRDSRRFLSLPSVPDPSRD